MLAARLLGAETYGADPADAGEILATALIQIMQQTGMPSGLAAIGFGEGDIDALVAGTLAQQRLTKLSPRSAQADDLAGLFRTAMKNW
jgi:alcohol dehydrogenase class IV